MHVAMPSVVACRRLVARLVARYSLVFLALCVYTVWIHGYAASRSPRVFDGAELADSGRPTMLEHGTADRRTGAADENRHGDVPSSTTWAADDVVSGLAVDVAPSTSSPTESTSLMRMAGALRLPLKDVTGSKSHRVFNSPENAWSTRPTATTYRPPEQLIVHVTWFYPPNTDFRFHEAICLMAIQRFVGPRKILFWYDASSTLPSGPWWQFARQSVAHLLPVPMSRPTSIYNRTVAVPEHQSDLARLELLERHGGLYVDLDVIVVRRIDDLVRATAGTKQGGSVVVMGAETPDMLGSGFILSPRPGAEFLSLWRRSYADGFDDTDWNRHSVYVPMQLARRRPELVRVEWFTINRPNWNERRWLFTPGALWDWSSNYAVHLWARDHPTAPVYDPATIRRMNTTTGEILRHVYYESSELLPEFDPADIGNRNRLGRSTAASPVSTQSARFLDGTHLPFRIRGDSPAL